MHHFWRLKRRLKKGAILPRFKKSTKEQISILKQNGNVVVTARPGSGKTYTVVEKIGLVLNELPDYKGIIAISFTKPILSYTFSKFANKVRRRCSLR